MERLWVYIIGEPLGSWFRSIFGRSPHFNIPINLTCQGLKSPGPIRHVMRTQQLAVGQLA